ncbi:transcription termination/antitermination factor NusG [Blastopirellula marina]|uniref:Transcription termination/antitermination protein NusG n=2 Tax=Blastopirellula marina TaxID=124 RepID=A0A2S8FIN8_9BACT|nr:transcription termination/antitermination factor NusG [Blastopirellula marina]PTL43101.1 transcription termination/antitermination factor NusG [Blastopirellula marina]
MAAEEDSVTEASSNDDVNDDVEADASEEADEVAEEEVAAEEASTEEEPPVPAARSKKRGPIEEITEEDEAAEESVEKDWYILKVQSNREKSICSNLIRRVKMAGLEDYFGEILVPTEDLVEYKNGKKKVTKQKLYPGYIVVHMAINDETWFVVRETGGIGDFTGAGGKPVPMLPHEVDRIVKKTRKPEEGEQEEVKTNIRFKIGDHVRITEGTFENFEGDVELIDETNGRVTVMINIFGRTTPVEMEHWQMEPV